MPLTLGLDLGTSSCKAVIFDPLGTALGRGRATYPIHRSAGGAAEVNPEDWWVAAATATRAALQDASCAAGAVGALAISGQIGNQVLLDAADRPLRPALIWQDLRAAAAARELQQTYGREQLLRWLDIDLPAGANWPAPRLLWLSRQEPETLGRTRRLMQAKDYLLYRLTGEAVTDASSWRGLIHQGSGRPASPLLERLGVDPGLLPQVLAPQAPAGRLTASAAAAFGLVPGTLVAVGWNDLNCAVLGSGAVNPSDAFDVGGTSEHLGRVLAVPASPSGESSPAGEASRPALAPPGLMRAPFLAALPVIYGVTSAGGGSLAWYANLTGGVEAALAQAAGAPAGSGELLFLPYLAGERAPIWDSAARGVFFGLSLSHGPQHLARAVLEGVAFSLRQVLAQVEAASGPIAELRVSGGPSRSSLWNRIKASVWNRPVLAVQEPEAACLGAAALAACAAGTYDSPATAARSMTRIAARVEPDPAWRQTCDSLYAVYESLYPVLQPSFQRLESIRQRRESHV